MARPRGSEPVSLRPQEPPPPAHCPHAGLHQGDDGRELHPCGHQAAHQPGTGARRLPRCGHSECHPCLGVGRDPGTAPWPGVVPTSVAIPQQTPAHLQGFVDSRHGDVTVVRPMRDYMAKEIAFYNHFFGVPTVITPPLHAKVGVPLSPPLPARLSCGSPHPTHLYSPCSAGRRPASTA